MSCLSERIAGAIIFLLSGYAFAGDLAIDSPEEMTVASIAPLPVKTLPSIPEPQRYAFEYQSDQGNPFYAPVENFYSTPITHDVRFGGATPAPMPGAASQQAPSQASDYLSLGPSTAPQLSIVDVQNTTLTLGAQPQRKLSLTVNDWAFSATARVAVLHSHSTGATLSVRHGF
ncbi:hypothetical protein PQR66_03705 [Paraburkholderia agricolaris]|uniref:Uncharacterized protein n=2 Tax=Paraburkholderia agricolaris TaxID=2152888 RepID=A0ABW8ZFZ0_9BURK